MMTILKTNFSGVKSMIKTVIMALNVFILRIARYSVTRLDFSIQKHSGFLLLNWKYWICLCSPKSLYNYIGCRKNVFSDPHLNVIIEWFYAMSELDICLFKKVIRPQHRYHYEVILKDVDCKYIEIL